MWLKLHDEDGEIMVSMDYVTWFAADEDGKAELAFYDGECLVVQESFEQITEMITAKK